MENDKEVHSVLDKTKNNHVLSIILLFFTTAFFCFVWLTMCGPKPLKDAGVGGKCSDGLVVGNTRKKQCPDGVTGEIVYECQNKDEAPVQVLNTCNNPVSGLTYDYLDSYTLSDFTNFGRADQIFIRHVSAIHKRLEGLSSVEAKKAIDKALNSLADNKVAITTSVAIDPEKSIFRFDLRDYGLSRDDWRRIENADKLNFVGKTNKSQTNQRIAATLKPWMHFDNLIDIAMSAELYYIFANIPKTLLEYQTQLGINFANDIVGFDANFLVTAKSFITNNKPRMLVRNDNGNAGVYWETFDILAVNAANKDPFIQPLLKESQSQKLAYATDGSEVIAQLPSGLHAYSLFDGNGNRVNEAPLALVRNPNSAVDKNIILNPVSCVSCHSVGFIPTVDELRSRVRSQFDADDREKILQLYGPASENAEFFKKDNEVYLAALAKLGIGVNEADPITTQRDIFRLNYDLKRTASYYFLTPEALSECIEQSAEISEAIGNLLNDGGEITHEQFENINPDILDQCRILEEPLR